MDQTLLASVREPQGSWGEETTDEGVLMNNVELYGFISISLASAWILGIIECIRLMEMCAFKRPAREADVAAHLAAKRPALGNITNLLMSAPSPPSSSSSRGSSLSL